jgi:hypothetical protein
LLRTEEGMSRLLAWLPSGEIAYQGPDGEGLFYLAPDGRTRLVPGACPAERKCQGKLIGSDYAQWTPSGGRVAVAGWNSRKRIAIFLGSSQGRDWRQVVELPVTKEVRALAVADSGQVAYIEGDRSAYGVEYEERVILVSADGKHQTLAISK